MRSKSSDKAPLICEQQPETDNIRPFYTMSKFDYQEKYKFINNNKSYLKLERKKYRDYFPISSNIELSMLRNCKEFYSNDYGVKITHIQFVVGTR